MSYINPTDRIQWKDKQNRRVQTPLGWYRLDINKKQLCELRVFQLVSNEGGQQ